MMYRVLFATALIAGFASPALAGDTRREAVKAADADDNFRLDGKEAKTLKKDHAEMYDNLLAFCETSVDAPKKNGVELPDGATDDQKECEKKHVAKPFLMAWIAQTETPVAEPAPAPAPEPSTPSGGDVPTPSGG
jgi:hypothetical protein